MPSLNTSSPGTSSGRTLSAETEAKKRRIVRACDVCRRKKIKCDGPQNSLSDAKCAHCDEFDLECTYVEAAKRRGPPKGYVETLVQRCERYEKILSQLHPHIDFDEYVGPYPDRDDFDINAYRDSLRARGIPPFPSMKPLQSLDRVTHQSSLPTSCSTSSSSATATSKQVMGASPWSIHERNPNVPDDEADVVEEAAVQISIANSMSQLQVRDAHWRYHGKASGAHLMRQFQDLKSETGNQTNIIAEINKSRRQQFWHVPEWELVIANEGLRPLDYSTWPERGLDQQLIDAYFDHINLHLPLLNRKFFQRQYDSEMWQTNHGFSRVCLMIFANGSRFVDDSRVYWPEDLTMSEEGRERLMEDKDGTIRYSAGWRFLRSLLRMGRSIMQGPNLYECQTQVLICQFLQGSAASHLLWIVSGFGLRSAQELGIHVRATLLHADPTERALYNRVFWCLYHIDRYNCAAIGRSVALQDSDLNADYPMDVDDEFWDTGDPERNFKQPEGRVSLVAAFTQTLKLDHIVGAALKTIYAINQLPEKRSDSSAQRSIVVELDSALNSWADNVPYALRWDPSRSDYRLFQQSAVLYVYYYYCQILIHRPFIPTPRNQHSTDLPSLAVCVNAARSICNISDAALKRGRQEGALPGRVLNLNFMLPSWIAAIILLINIYSGKQTTIEREKAMVDIRRCLAVSKELEVIWRQSGKYTDFLTELSKESGMPDADKVAPTEKRPRDDGDESRTGQRHSGQWQTTANTPPSQKVSSSSSTPGIGSHSEISNTRSMTHEHMQSSDEKMPSYRVPTDAPVSSIPPHRGEFTMPIANISSQPSASSDFHSMFQQAPQSHQQPSVQLQPSFGPGYQPDHSVPNPSVYQQIPAHQDAQAALYDSLMGMTSFESQLLDMSTTAFGGQDNTIESDWWSQLFSESVAPDIPNQNDSVHSETGGPRDYRI